MKRIRLILIGVMILVMSGCLFLFHDLNKSLLIFFNKDGSIDYVIHQDGTVTKFYKDGSKRHYDPGQYGPSSDGGWDYKYGPPGEKYGYKGRTIWVDHGDGRVTWYTANGEKLYTRDSQGNRVWYDRDGREAFREDADGTITLLIEEKERVEGVDEIKNKMTPPAAYIPGEIERTKNYYEDDIFNKPLPSYNETGNPGSTGTDEKPKPYPLYSVKKPDGSSITVFSDGSRVTYYPDGSVHYRIGPGYHPNITYYKDGEVWYVEDYKGNVIYHSGETIPDDVRKGNREEVDKLVQNLEKATPSSKRLEGNSGPEYGYEGEKGDVKEEAKEEKTNKAQIPETEVIGTPTPKTGDNKETGSFNVATPTPGTGGNNETGTFNSGTPTPGTKGNNETGSFNTGTPTPSAGGNNETGSFKVGTPTPGAKGNNETGSFNTGTPTPNTSGNKETGSFNVATPTPGTEGNNETGSFNVGTPTPKPLMDDFERDSDGNLTYYYTDGKKAYTVHPDGSVTYYDDNGEKTYTKHKDGTITYHNKKEESTKELSEFLEGTETGDTIMDEGDGSPSPGGGHSSYE